MKYLYQKSFNCYVNVKTESVFTLNDARPRTWPISEKLEGSLENSHLKLSFFSSFSLDILTNHQNFIPEAHSVLAVLFVCNSLCSDL